jgi:hypothetical protein
MTMNSENTPTTSESRFVCRLLETEQDWWRVRNLLIETFPLTGPGFNWELRHWEGNRFHRVSTAWEASKYANHHLWETGGGRLVGVAHEDGSWIWLEIHPDYRASI